MKLNKKKQKLLDKPKKIEEDWEIDFDFSQYENEDTQDNPVETIKDLKRPRVTGLRSRFSNGVAELERLSEINKLITKYGIEVASRTQELPVLWRFYGTLDEYWESIRNLFGSHLNEEMAELQKQARQKLNDQAQKGGKIDTEVHEKLLEFRSLLYRLKQLSNLGFEVDTTRRSAFRKSKDQVIQ